MKTNHVLNMIVAAGLGAHAAHADVNFYIIGDPTTEFLLANDISDNGIATVERTGNAPYSLWSVDGGLITIGGVGAGNGIGGGATISRDGLFVGGTFFNTTQNYAEWARYDVTADIWTGFGMIPVIGRQLGQAVSAGYGISGDGLNVVGGGWTTEGTADYHAIRWTVGSGITDFGTNVVGNSARANRADLDGSVVTGWQDGPGRQGCVWVDGIQELIFQTDATIAGDAWAVSEDGTWVSGSDVGDINGSLWRYNTVTNVSEDLGNIETPSEQIIGYDMTADGSLIVGSTWEGGPAFAFGTGFVWQDGIGMMTASEYFASLGAVIDPSLTLTFISGVSSDATWFTGWGLTLGDEVFSWVVEITPQCAFCDCNADGVLNVDDIDCFVSAFLGGDLGDADCDGSGTLNVDDIDCYVTCFLAGCPGSE
ncbi:MAG: hypothetical protein DHS20C14_01570 [Phycisphaeraceae bacterium]|nr:MAG: hypothetical protein DHS20C14_01570 [Phycisphaeraceae bacterium]